MARKSVQCPCGTEFAVPEILPKLLHCPKCGDPVVFSSVDADGHVRAGEDLRDRPIPPRPIRNPYRRLVLLAAAGFLMAVGLVVLIIQVHRRTVPASPLVSSPERTPAPLPRTLTSGEPRAIPLARPESRPDPADLRRQLGEASERANMTGLASALLVNTGMTLEAAKVQNRLRSCDERIQELLQQLQEQGFPAPAPERFRWGDCLTRVGGASLDPLRAPAFAEAIRAWIGALQPGASESVTVVRAGRPVTFDVRFSDRSPELLALARPPDAVAAEVASGGAPVAEPKPLAPTPLPSPLLAEVKQRLETLPAFYRQTLPAQDRSRAEALLVGGHGSNDDTIFLTGRFSELLRRAESDQNAIAARLRELEAKLAESADGTDTVVCKDRKIEGTILESTDEFVKIKGRFGAVTISRAEILTIEKGKGSGADFKAAYQAARGRKSELLQLFLQAREQKAELRRGLAAAALLSLDPGEDRCRHELGLPRNPYAGVPDPPAVSPDDRIEYLGKRYSPEQLRQELLSLGYVEMNGLWCEKVAKEFLIDNLYRDTGAIRGATVQSQTHTEQDTVYDYRSRAWVPRTKIVATARYVGNGVCHIEIAAPGPLLEARIHARSQVSRPGGTVTVSVVTDPGEKAGKVLYVLGAPGENDGTHDATEKVFGRDRFYVRAQVKGTGMFLVSDSNDHGVFEVKYTYGKPLERLNAILANRRAGGTDQVESTCRDLATGVAQTDLLIDALAEMRRRTESLVYSREFLMPSRFDDVVTRLKDPLFPDWSGMTREQAFRLGSWWGALPADDRREFLASYGLWCARARWTRAMR
jgi:hypothetical protein